jgi:hypothetical protein
VPLRQVLLGAVLRRAWWLFGPAAGTAVAAALGSFDRLGAFARLPVRADVAVIGVALIFGVVLTVVLERRDTGFTREDELLSTLSVPVLAIVPEMTTTYAGQAVSRRQILGICVLLALLFASLLWLRLQL